MSPTSLKQIIRRATGHSNPCLHRLLCPDSLGIAGGGGGALISVNPADVGMQRGNFKSRKMVGLGQRKRTERLSSSAFYRLCVSLLVDVAEDAADASTPSDDIAHDGNHETTAMSKRIRIFSAEDVAAHNSASSCWISHGGKVYDVTKFLNDHPGGDDLILEHAGKDVAEIMKDANEHEHSDSAYDMLEEYLIGRLVVGEATVREGVSVESVLRVPC